MKPNLETGSKVKQVKQFSRAFPAIRDSGISGLQRILRPRLSNWIFSWSATQSSHTGFTLLIQQASLINCFRWKTASWLPAMVSGCLYHQTHSGWYHHSGRKISVIFPRRITSPCCFSKLLIKVEKGFFTLLIDGAEIIHSFCSFIVPFMNRILK